MENNSYTDNELPESFWNTVFGSKCKLPAGKQQWLQVEIKAN